MELTIDNFLDGKLRILQPGSGYRVSIDPIVLSGLVQVKPEQKILDAGCGVGTISLILKHREATIDVSAVDIDEDMCDICRQNAVLNDVRVSVIRGSIDECDFGVNTFDQVVTNPPFYDKSAFRVSKNRELANFETISLKTWIVACLRSLKNGGVFSIIHVANRIGELINILRNRVGNICVIPVFTRADLPAKRVVITGVRGSRSDTRIMPGVVVHNDDGTYTDVMKKFLMMEKKL